jgi:hypothetical protein
MSILEYTLIHAAISSGIVGAVLYQNKGVQWVPGGMVIAMTTASFIALGVVGLIAVVDWLGYF